MLALVEENGEGNDDELDAFKIDILLELVNRLLMVFLLKSLFPFRFVDNKAAAVFGDEDGDGDDIVFFN